MSHRTHKIEIHLAKGESGLEFVSKGLRHIFDSNVGKEFGVMLGRKGPQKPNFVHDIVLIHSLMIYTDLIEYKVDDDTKTPLLPCFLFISKPKAGDIISTGQYMNYQTFRKLQFRPLLKKSFFFVFTLTWETRAVKKHPSYLLISVVFFGV